MIKSSRTMPPASPRSVTGYDYGPSFNQIHLMNGEVLHNMGLPGSREKIIAILDAGFQNAADINLVLTV